MTGIARFNNYCFLSFIILYLCSYTRFSTKCFNRTKSFARFSLIIVNCQMNLLHVNSHTAKENQTKHFFLQKLKDGLNFAWYTVFFDNIWSAPLNMQELELSPEWSSRSSLRDVQQSRIHSRGRLPWESGLPGANQGRHLKASEERITTLIYINIFWNNYNWKETGFFLHIAPCLIVIFFCITLI